MIDYRRWFFTAAMFVLSIGLASAQVGVRTGGPTNSPLSCNAVGNDTQLRPEGYTELLGDIFITCTGGPVMQTGAPVPTTVITVYVYPAQPITSRYLGPSPSGI